MAVSDTAVRDFLLANPNLTDAQIVDAMKEYNVTPTQLSRVTGVPENEIFSRAAAVDPQVDLYEPVQQALKSKDLTQDQFDTLSAYFGNEMTLNEASRDPKAPTIKSYVKDPRSGYEFATFLATRGAEQGGNESVVNNFVNLIRPYIGQEVGYTVTQPDSDGGQPELRITDPVTGRKVDLQYASDNTYRNIVSSLSGRESGPKSSFFSAGVDYQLDPNTGRLTIKSPYVQQYIDKGNSGVDIAKMLASAALTYFGAPYLGNFGTALAQGALGEATGGDFLKSFGGSLLGGELQQFTGAGTLDDFALADASQLAAQGIGADQISQIMQQSYNFAPALANQYANLGQDAAFVAADADQLYKQTGNVAAVQQNLIAAGVDPTLAASAAQNAAMGMDPTQVAADIGGYSAGAPIFSNQGLLSGGSTMDEFSKNISGISSTAGGPNIGEVIRTANQISKALTPVQQQTGLGVRNQQQRPAGVDYSSLLALLQGQAKTPNVASLLG